MECCLCQESQFKIMQDSHRQCTSHWLSCIHARQMVIYSLALNSKECIRLEYTLMPASQMQLNLATVAFLDGDSVQRRTRLGTHDYRYEHPRVFGHLYSCDIFTREASPGCLPVHGSGFCGTCIMTFYGWMKLLDF